ncbi:MAG: hypothetical protein LQ340_004477, partial [Diploschistes diacapsis]
PHSTLLVAIDFDLFSTLSSGPTHLSALASATGASSALLQRLLRHLAATSVVLETGPDTFAPTALTQLLTDPRHAAALHYSDALPTPVLAVLPRFLADTDYRDPCDQRHGPFQHAMRTDKSPWDWARGRRDLAGVFALHMSGYHAKQGSWMDAGFYPVAERLVAGCREGDGEVLLVDVGGGLGHDLEEFREKHGELVRGRRMVLQDLGVMVKGARELRPWVEAQAHDFFGEQGVKGARAYLLHSVLHDWQDEAAVRILSNLREAMQPGYSKVLVYEHVIPEKGASWKSTSLDLTMMGTASKERTEAQWREVVDAAGLRISGIWTQEPGSESLIEVVTQRTSKL